MADQTEAQAKLVQYLTEAHGKEKELEKARRSSPDSAASGPSAIPTRWFNRSPSSNSYTLRAAPAFGSVAAYTSCPSRALTIAPAHIAHGSSVTYSVHSSSRHCPR